MQAVDGHEQTSEGGERYRMGEVIGRGGLGEVYRAEDTQLHRPVAIKRLHGVDDPAGEGAARIMQEARHLAALQHPNIVTIYDVIARRGDVVVVMELLQGRTLQEVAESAPLGMREFVDVMRQTLAGLIAAHAQGMLHRDIKPSNLMLSKLPSGGSQLKILDFGMAKIAPEPSRQTKDHEGALMGSIFMMSPEQLEGTPLDARSDLYSLGCVAYFALTATYPFSGKTVVEVITAHLQGRRVPLKEMRPDLPVAVCSWVERLMALRPAERPESASDALEEFEIALEARQTFVRLETPAPAVAEVRPRFRFHLPRVRLADLGVAFFLVAICVFAFHQLTKSRAAALPPVTPEIAVGNTGAILDRTGQAVTVEGVVGKVIPGAGGLRKLTFEGLEPGGLSLVFFSTESPAEFVRRLSTYVGRKVRVTGVVSAPDGAPQIFVESFSQLQTL
jgi:hypothetical protein